MFGVMINKCDGNYKRDEFFVVVVDKAKEFMAVFIRKIFLKKAQKMVKHVGMFLGRNLSSKAPGHDFKVVLQCFIKVFFVLRRNNLAKFFLKLWAMGKINHFMLAVKFNKSFCCRFFLNLMKSMKSKDMI